MFSLSLAFQTSIQNPYEMLNVIYLNDKYQRTASFVLERKEDVFRQFFIFSFSDHLSHFSSFLVLIQVVRLCAQCSFIECFPGPNQRDVYAEPDFKGQDPGRAVVDLCAA